MLRIGLTGGIGAGKSTVARRLAERGATVVDADTIAREVLAPGTEGLQQVAETFPGVADGGELDRAALAAIVFGDTAKRRQLEAITHPLIAARTAEIARAVPTAGVLVHDVPLLVEARMAPAYHLVIVVEAPLDLRLHRLVARGLPAGQARDRMASQASDAARREAADVLLVNAGDVAALTAHVDARWPRLSGYAANLAAGRRAPRPALILRDPDPDWPRQAAHLAARLAAATGRRVDHVGSTAVPGLAAKDVLDLMVTVTDLADADALAETLSAQGFPRLDDIRGDNPKPPDTAPWPKRFHANADPGRPANVHVRAADSPGWTYALAFRDWLRAVPAESTDYEAAKRAAAKQTDIEAYQEAKEPWFDAAWPRLRQWITAEQWSAPESVIPPA